MVFQSQMNSKTTVSEIKHLIMGLTEEECAAVLEAYKKTAPSAANTEDGKEAQHDH